jgi:hypothetical protein
MGHSVAQSYMAGHTHTIACTQNAIQCHTHPTPPIRNLLFFGTPHGGIDTGPFRKLGNSGIKTGITAFVKRFFGVFFIKLDFNRNYGEGVWV